MKRRMNSSKSGFSLIEVLVAMAILGIGAMLSLKLLGVFINTNRGLSANQEAAALATRLMSEVMDAEYRSSSAFDPGLAVSSGAVENPVPGSSIVSVGQFATESYEPLPNNPPAGVLAKFRTRYLVSNCQTCTTPIASNTGLLGPGGVEIMIEVANAANDGPLLRPIRMAVRRTFSHALVCANVAPGDPCNVRGYN